MSKIYDFLKECKVFFLASVNDNKPAVRPFGAVMEYRNELYFSTSNNKEVYHQIVETPNIQIIALKNGTREWIRINGKAVEEKSLEIKQLMLDTCPVLTTHFQTNDCPIYALFKITEMQAALNTDKGIISL